MSGLSAVVPFAELNELTEALVTDVEIPQVDPKIIRRDVRLLI
jgi:hypothetical protein